MPIPASVRPGAGARRAAVLDLVLAADGPVTVAAAAAELGLHPNTVRAHLDVLVREGRLTRRTEVRATRGRPRELYEPTGAPDRDGSHAVLARMLAEQLAAIAPDPAAEAVDVGRRWAEHEPVTAPDGVQAVVQVLRRSGFAPELTPDGRRVLLHHCPFRELARDHPEIVCGAHLGLIQGTLDRAAAAAAARAAQAGNAVRGEQADPSATGAAASDPHATTGATGTTGARIVPFVTPDLCVAELPGSTQGSAATSGGDGRAAVSTG